MTLLRPLFNPVILYLYVSIINPFGNEVEQNSTYFSWKQYGGKAGPQTVQKTNLGSKPLHSSPSEGLWAGMSTLRVHFLPV